VKYKLIIRISKALLLARWKQTLVAAVGVSFSIAMFITLLGFMNGLNGLLDGLVTNRTPHVRLYNEVKISSEQPIDKSDEYGDDYNFVNSLKPKNDNLDIKNSIGILHALAEDERVLGVCPRVSSQVFYNAGNVRLNGMVNGIDVEGEKEFYAFEDYMIAGNSSDIDAIPNSIILGVGVAENLLADLGDIIQLTNSKGEIIKLKVVGMYQSGMADIDKVQSYASVKTTQKILGVSNDYLTDIQIKLTDMSLAPALAKEYEALFGTSAIDIQSSNAQFDTGNSIRGLISYAVGITLLIVAGFGIYNILNMLIYEKMDSIAILKATGFSGKDVSNVFIMIALTIGIIGGAVGLLIGFGLCNIIDNIPFDTEALPTVTTYPIDYGTKYYIIAGVFSVVTTYLAGYFPSRKASKVDPVEIIRGK